MIKAILFDFYGTLVEEDDLYIDRICEDISMNSPSEIVARDIGGFWYKRFLNLCNLSFGSEFLPQRDIELQSLKDTILHFNSESDADALSEILFAYWSSPKPFKNTAYVLRKLTLPTCIVSNIDDQDIKSALNGLSYTPNYVVTSESEKSYKPRVEMFERALNLLNFLPSEVIHIGDSYSSDIIGSSVLGIPNIWLNPKKRTKGRGVSPSYEVTDIIDILPIIDAFNQNQ